MLVLVVVEDGGLFWLAGGKCFEGVEWGLAAGLTKESGLESSERLYWILWLMAIGSSLGEKSSG